MFIIDKEVLEGNWQQWWPEPDLDLSAPSEYMSEEDLTSQADLFMERSRRRLAVYNMAKELLLAQRLFKLESSIIEKASTILDGVEMCARDIKALSSVFKEMTQNSISSTLSSLTLGQDDNGMPTVILRDLSGK